MQQRGEKAQKYTTFGQCSNNILKGRIKAAPGSNHPAVNCISLQNKERKISGQLMERTADLSHNTQEKMQAKGQRVFWDPSELDNPCRLNYKNVCEAGTLQHF